MKRALTITTLATSFLLSSCAVLASLRSLRCSSVRDCALRASNAHDHLRKIRRGEVFFARFPLEIGSFLAMPRARVRQTRTRSVTDESVLFDK